MVDFKNYVLFFSPAWVRGAWVAAGGRWQEAAPEGGQVHGGGRGHQGVLPGQAGGVRQAGVAGGQGGGVGGGVHLGAGLYWPSHMAKSVQWTSWWSHQVWYLEVTTIYNITRVGSKSSFWNGSYVRPLHLSTLQYSDIRTDTTAIHHCILILHCSSAL